MEPPVIYQFRIREQLDPALAAWFAPLEIANDPSGEATLTGPVVDQAALQGLIDKVFSMNFTLLAVNRIGRDAAVP
jgi:hypothetical protein